MTEPPNYRFGGARALVLLHERERRAFVETWRDARAAGLKNLTEEASEHPEHRSRWGPLYCIDAMLEHAVMHPLRHRFQLEGLLAAD